MKIILYRCLTAYLHIIGGEKLVPGHTVRLHSTGSEISSQDVIVTLVLGQSHLRSIKVHSWLGFVSQKISLQSSDLRKRLQLPVQLPVVVSSLLPSGHRQSHVFGSNILGDGHAWFRSHSHVHVFWLRNKGWMHDFVQQVHRPLSGEIILDFSVSVSNSITLGFAQ